MVYRSEETRRREAPGVKPTGPKPENRRQIRWKAKIGWSGLDSQGFVPWLRQPLEVVKASSHSKLVGLGLARRMVMCLTSLVTSRFEQ